MKMTHHLAVLTTLTVLSIAATASAALIEDFDGGGNTAFNLTNSGGAAPALLNGGATGDFIRLANLNGSNNNSIAFDENPSVTGPQPAGMRLLFDFRMSDDAANAAAGGCCDSAADGLGIGLFSTATYGATGGANPPAMGQGSTAWERPALNDAFTIGLDIFQNIDQVNLNWAGSEVANADVQPFLDLNSGLLHRAIVDVQPSGGDAVVDMTILEDVHGNTSAHSIFSGQVVSGLDLNALGGFRLIAGGRTGGAFVAGDLDNIFLVPEPGSLTLLGLGSLLLLARRRRRC